MTAPRSFSRESPGPASADLSLARVLAQRIVVAEGASVQRVVMIGSRALGTARPDSDLDLLVLMEVPADVPPWGPRENMAARERLHPVVSASPIPTEVWVRTTDRFQEARDVIGGVEHSAAHAGVDVFARPPARAPVVRRTRDQVRNELVSACVEHALTALEGTLRLQGGPPPPAHVPGAPRTAGRAAEICIERALIALLVLHQRPIEKRGGIALKLASLGECDAHTASAVREVLDAYSSPVRAAYEVLRTIVYRLQRDCALRPYVEGSSARLSKLNPTSTRAPEPVAATVASRYG